ncbi:MAG: hypothetical protein WC436_01205 [Candidatus Babeliales bacterium]
MYKKTQYIINYNKKSTLQVLIIMPAMILGMLFLFSKIYKSTSSFNGSNFFLFLVILFLKIILCFGIAIFIIGTIYSIFLLLSKIPATIIDQNGIWIKYYNFIPWENIDQVSCCPIAGNIESICIKVKNPNLAVKNSDWQGKMNFFWAKLFKREYHIFISNVDINNNDILLFIKNILTEKFN